MADGLTTEANRQHMLSVAADYDRLAAQTAREEERARHRPHANSHAANTSSRDTFSRAS